MALFIANLIYGINYTVAKEVMPTFIKPFGFILVRAIGASLLFWLFSPFLKSTEKIEKKDFGRIALCALFGVAINQLLFFKGLSITGPINASIIMTTNPVLVLITASVILRERISTNKLVGIGLGITGALLIILSKSSNSFNSTTYLGDLLVFINAASYGVYLVLVKPLMMKYQPLTVIKWVFLIGFTFVLPFGWDEFSQIQWSTMPTHIYAQVAFVVIGTTFIAYLFNTYALKRLSPITVSIYIYSQPLLASFIALLLQKDELTAQKVLAAVLIFLGVYLVSKPKKQV